MKILDGVWQACAVPRRRGYSYYWRPATRSSGQHHLPWAQQLLISAAPPPEKPSMESGP